MTDPSLYRVSTPDFRALAAKYPATFGKLYVPLSFTIADSLH